MIFSSRTRQSRLCVEGGEKFTSLVALRSRRV